MNESFAKIEAELVKELGSKEPLVKFTQELHKANKKMNQSLTRAEISVQKALDYFDKEATISNKPLTKSLV